MRGVNSKSTVVDAWSNGRLVDASAAAPLGVAVVGYGYWGPNLARNVAERPELELVALCEPDETRAGAFSQRYPDVPVRVEPGRRPRQRRGRSGARGDASADPLPDRQAGARGRASRAGREAAGHDVRGRPRARGAGRVAGPRADAGPHLRLQPGRQHGPRPDPRRRRGRGLLRHLRADEPRQVPARRRDLRPRAARPVDPALLARASPSCRSPRRPAASSRPASPRPRS